MKSKKITQLAVYVLAFICISATVFRTKNVLIIGDSISIGYTPFIEKALAGTAIVTHNPGNGGSTVRGVQNVEKWLDGKEWDVIVFNFGLHDLVYKDSLNKYNIEKGKVSVPLADYEKNLVQIVAKLRETTATLIFATTTVVPENSTGRKVEDPAKYNEMALAIMKKNNIAVIDLYKTSQTVHPQNSKPGNVHYTEKGYELLAEPIIKKIKDVLKEKK
jgi:lysophospholipase L1-like esterase